MTWASSRDQTTLVSWRSFTRSRANVSTQSGPPTRSVNDMCAHLAGDKFTYPHREVGDPDRTSLPYPGLSRRVRHPALFVCTQETSEEVCSVI